MSNKKHKGLRVFFTIILIIILLVAAIVLAALFTPVSKIAKLAHLENTSIAKEVDFDELGDLRLFDILQLAKAMKEEPKIEHVDIPTDEDRRSLEEKKVFDDNGDLSLEEGTEYVLNQNEVALIMERVIKNKGCLVNGCKIESGSIGFSVTIDLDLIGVDLSPIPGGNSIHNPVMYFEYDVNVVSGKVAFSNGVTEISGLDQITANKITNSIFKTIKMDANSIGEEISKEINKIGEIISISSNKMILIGK